MSNLTNLSITAMLSGLGAKDFSARELVQAHVDAVEGARTLNSFITETPEAALAAADAADKAYADGTSGKLAGIPLGIKDNLATKGDRLTAASNILGEFKPPYESFVTNQLKQAGASILGKLNLDEFAMGVSNESSAFGPVVSPWRANGSDDKLVPGGSSGGSAAAVAARIVAGALGTDTGGSIRQPAALSGIVGLKPSYGRCSRWGAVALASSLDHIGPMARTVEDCALLLEVMAGFDANDSTSLDLPVPEWTANLSPDLKGKRVGIPSEYRADGINPEVVAAWDKAADWLRDAGAEIVEISLPHTDAALAAYYVISSAEASSNLSRYDGIRFGLRVQPENGNLDDIYYATRKAGFGPDARRRVLFGTLVLTADFFESHYVRAQKVRTLVIQDFTKAFEACDLLLTPTAPNAAFPLGASASQTDAYLNDMFTIPTSLAGLPAISVPAATNAQGLPLGLQLIGKPLDEQSVLNAGLALQQAAGFDALPERWW